MKIKVKVMRKSIDLLNDLEMRKFSLKILIFNVLLKVA